METMRNLRIYRLVVKCENELIDIANTLQTNLDNFNYCLIPAARAKKIYFKQIARAKFYCKIMQKLLNAADSRYLDCESLIYKSLADFSNYIEFFEN